MSVHIRELHEGVPLQLIVSNLLGRSLIRQTVPNGQTLDITALPPGLYILTSATGSGVLCSGKHTLVRETSRVFSGKIKIGQQLQKKQFNQKNTCFFGHPSSIKGD